MKKHHTTIVLLTLFFTGLIVLWWASYLEVPTVQELDANRNLVLPRLAKVSVGQIRKLTINRQPDRDADEELKPSRLSFERRDDRWQLVEPINVAADSRRLEILVQNLKNLAKFSEAGTIQDSGARFGLNPGGVSIQIFGTDEKTPLASLELGKTFGEQLYVRPDGDPGIEVVDARIFQGIQDQVHMWREKQLFNLSTFQVGGLKIKGKDRDLEAERSGGHWRLERPIRVLGDDGALEGVLGELTSLRLADDGSGFVADDVADRGQYGLDDTQAVAIELQPTLKQFRSQRLLIGNPVPDRADTFYALPADQDDVVMIRRKGIRDLGLKPNTLRSKQVADFEPARTDFLQIETSEQSFSAARSETGWSLVQPTRAPADHQVIETLLKQLRELQTSEFLDAGATARAELDRRPQMTLKLWQLRLGERLPKEPTDRPLGDLKVDLKLGRHDVLLKTIFAQLAGDPTILTVPDQFMEALPQNALAFRERTLVKLSPGQVRRLSVVRDGQTIRLAPVSSGDPNRWRMEMPVEAPAELEAVTKALMMLTELRAQRLITDKPTDLRPFGLSAPTMVITWSLPSEGKNQTDSREDATQTLKIGARVPNSESWFASLSDSPLIFVVSDAVVLPFRAEFRNRRILSFQPTRIERLTLRWPDRSLSFDHHPTPRGGVQDWSLAAGSTRSSFDLSRLPALTTELAKLNTRQYVQYSGPIAEASGLLTPTLTVEYQLRKDSTTHTLRIGNPMGEAEYYATTAPGAEGTVFVLGGSGWSDLLRPVGQRGSNELPEDVFAP